MANHSRRHRYQPCGLEEVRHTSAARCRLWQSLGRKLEVSASGGMIHLPSSKGGSTLMTCIFRRPKGKAELSMT